MLSCWASTAAQQRFGLFDSRLVAEAVEQIPAQPDRDQPVGPALIVKSLPVRFEGAVQHDVRQKAAAGVRRLSFGKTGGELCLASFGTVRNRALFVIRKQSVRQIGRRELA